MPGYKEENWARQVTLSITLAHRTRYLKIFIIIIQTSILFWFNTSMAHDVMPRASAARTVEAGQWMRYTKENCRFNHAIFYYTKFWYIDMQSEMMEKLGLPDQKSGLSWHVRVVICRDSGIFWHGFFVIYPRFKLTQICVMLFNFKLF